MNTSIHSTLQKFFGVMGPADRERYKLGVLDFTGKVSELIEALDAQDENRIRFLLHSVKPLSAYLKLDPLTEILGDVRELYKKDPVSTKNKLQDLVAQIEAFVGKL